jgi:hypothetical protein
LAAEIAWIRHLFTLTISATEIYRWTDCDQNIVYGGNWYTTKGIEFSPPAVSTQLGVGSITLTIDNVDKWFSTLVLSTNVSGKAFVIERVALDENIQVLGTPETIFFGYLDEGPITRKEGRIEVNNHMIKWRVIQCPRRLHSPSCPWIFKSTTYCTYDSTENWCDHTWERCTALGKTLYHGGFPSISDMVNKEIWWGRKSSGSPI